jgi:3-oxoacyl-[acyl-carrier-protein] synthase-3/clorobiocin biosynthesis protein CloN2
MFISGVGVYLPPTVSIEQAVAEGRYPAEQAAEHGLLGAAVAGDTPAPEMALRAATQALTRAQYPPTDIDLLLYADSWHQGPDGWQPQYYLQHHLTGGTPLAVEIHHGCNGMFSALELAASYLRADPRRTTALLVAADNFGTPMIDRWRSGHEHLIGDAGSAVVLTTRPEGAFARLLAVGASAIPEAEELHRAGEPLFPPGATLGRTVDFVARGEAFQKEMANGADASAMAKIGGSLVGLIGRTLAEAGVTTADITRVAPMNFSRALIERLMIGIGLTMEQSTWEWGRTVGHLGASDQVIALERLVSTGELGPGDHLLMLGMGPGATLSCAIVGIVAEAAWQE